MLIKKTWTRYKKKTWARFNRETCTRQYYTGYFLFGLIPIFIDRRTEREVQVSYLIFLKGEKDERY